MTNRIHYVEVVFGHSTHHTFYYQSHRAAAEAAHAFDLHPGILKVFMNGHQFKAGMDDQELQRPAP